MTTTQTASMPNNSIPNVEALCQPTGDELARQRRRYQSNGRSGSTWN